MGDLVSGRLHLAEVLVGFVILEIMFLSIAGPIGTATGLDLDDLVMLILAINFPSYNRVDS